MVFAVAVLLAFVHAGGLASSPPQTSLASDSTAPRPEQAKPIPMRLSTQQLTGQGERLGTAYRLQSGEVVYVPDDPKP